MLWLHRANAVQRWLPPGLAANMLQDCAGQPAASQALESFALLGIFVLGTGGVLGARLRGGVSRREPGRSSGAERIRAAQGRVADRRLGPGGRGNGKGTAHADARHAASLCSWALRC